jgi:RNA-directed DNA polymerase
LRFARYADDFQIYVRTHRSARRVFASVERFLTRKLKLVVNQQKSRIAKTDGVEFLGFKFVGRRGEIRVTAKNLAKFKQRVRSIPGRSRGISMSRRLGELRSYLRGWKGYWHLAKTLGGQMGMTKKWLLDQGLVFLRYLWSELAPLRRTG